MLKVPSQDKLLIKKANLLPAQTSTLMELMMEHQVAIMVHFLSQQQAAAIKH
jgi:hypothetical protein